MKAHLHDALPIGVLTLDERQRVRCWNRWLEEQTGIPRERALGRTLAELFPGHKNPRFHWAVDQTIRSRSPQLLSQALHHHLIPIPLPPLQKNDPRLMPQQVHIDACEVEGEVLAVVSVLEMTESVLRTTAITEMALRLEHDLNRDPLTGLYNRRFMNDWLEQQCKQAARYGYSLVAMMIDLDNFKTLNDTYGHPVGDRILVDYADLLRENLRDSDVVVRYGGDEFLALLPRCDMPLARDAAQRLRDRTVGGSLGGLPPGQVRCSIGLSLFDPATPCTPDAFLRNADKCLYQSKQGGRNRISAGTCNGIQ